MDIETYLSKFPDSEIYAPYISRIGKEIRSYKKPFDIISHAALEIGVLQFNSESADYWAGPFPGNYVLYYAKDYSLDTRIGKNGEKVSVLSLLDEYANAQRKLYFETSIDEVPKELRRRVKIMRNRGDGMLFEHPTSDLPFGLKFSGTDNTSYSKFFNSKEELMEVLDLLKIGEPLDFYQDFLPLNFVFTN